MTRIFAKLINNGFRILISTHSDYVIREINNLIMASSIKDGVIDKAKELGYAETMKLPHSKVGAYLLILKTRVLEKSMLSQ